MNEDISIFYLNQIRELDYDNFSIISDGVGYSNITIKSGEFGYQVVGPLTMEAIAKAYVYILAKKMNKEGW